MKFVFFLFVCLSFLNASFAQKKTGRNKKEAQVAPAIKKPLHHDVYDFWEEIPEQALSDDGKFLAFVIQPQQGDGILHVKTREGVTVATISRGNEARFTSDSHYLLFKIKPEFDKVKAARRAGKKKEELPKDSLGLLSLASGAITKWPAVVSYKIPEKGQGWFAFLADNESEKDTAGWIAPKGRKSEKEGVEKRYTLVVRHLPGEKEYRYPSVKEYTFSKNGSRLAFESATDEGGYSAGVTLVEKEGLLAQTIREGHTKHVFSKLSFDEKGEQLAFIADLDTNSKTQIRYPKLFYWKTGDAAARLRLDELSQPAGAGWLINSEYAPTFSKNGQVLYFGINPVPIVLDTMRLPEEIVNVEVWHWQDKKLQTQQKVTSKTDKKRAYLAAHHLSENRSVRLASDALEAVSLVNEGDASYVLLSDPSPYAHEHWDWNPKSDVYQVNTMTGEKKQVKKKLEGRANASPNGKYIYWFSNTDTAWEAYSVEKGTTTQMTHNQRVRFADEEDDHPDYPKPYGVAGWTTGDEHILVYDRYDIWMIDPSKPTDPVRLTEGRSQRQRYRYQKLDPEERAIDPNQNLLLRSFNEASKQEGFYRFDLKNRRVVKKYEGDFRIGANIRKARSSDEVLFTQETFRDFPNWYLSDGSFEKVSQVTYANSQQNEYAWGSVELVSWKNADGKLLQGLLYKPDNFDENRKYPLMTYFYEKNSDQIHTHFAPKPIRSYINFSYFTSNGYLVFVPDVVYEVGYPGQSAYNCVVPGVLSLLDKGFVDRDRIGISGHSWGGYQTAYIITRTNLFKAAEAGAPVSNMTSAYGGVRWDTGLVRQAQYERTQSRIGGTLWEKPLLYIENSPLFFANRVKTPLLMMHNDEDGAVPWYQGIEYFLALKRLNKPVWMLNYTGEKHGLTQRQNMTDFAIRLYQFFDHYLQDAPMPRWMSQGVPYIEKGIRQGLEPTSTVVDE